MPTNKASARSIIWAPTSWSVYSVDTDSIPDQKAVALSGSPLAAVLDALEKSGKARKLNIIQLISINEIDNDEDEEFFMGEETV